MCENEIKLRNEPPILIYNKENDRWQESCYPHDVNYFLKKLPLETISFNICRAYITLDKKYWSGSSLKLRIPITTHNIASVIEYCIGSEKD